MMTLATWYPGDRFVLGVLQTFGLITILIVLAWLGERLLARRQAAWRCALWQATLLGALLAPWSVFLGQQSSWRLLSWSWTASTELSTLPPALPVHSEVITPSRGAPAGRSADAVPAAARPLDAATAARGSTPPSDATTMALAVPAPNVEPVAPRRPIPWGPALITAALLVWLGGSIYLGLRLLVGSHRLRKLLSDSMPLPADQVAVERKRLAHALDLATLPPLAVCPRIGSPVVVGLVRPCVLLPVDLVEQVTDQQLTDILVHECAHIVRRDLWINLLQRCTTLLFWVHPLVYLLHRRLDEAREEVCDNYVLACSSGPDYAETLLTVAQVCYPGPLSGGYLTMLPRHANLEDRVIDLLAEQRDTATRLSRRSRWLLAGGLLLLLFAGSFIGLRDAAADAQEPKAPPSAEKPADKPAEPLVRGRVTGRLLLAADDRPLAGVTVQLLRNTTIIGEPKTRKATTNDQGEFTFDGVAAGSYQAYAFQGNLMSRSRMYGGDRVVVEPDGSSKPVALKMKPGLEVKVKVVSQETGKPIPDARIRLIWTDTQRDHRTAADGTVVLQALTPETWHIQAAAKDHAAQVQVFNLGNMESATAEFRLPPGGSLQGIVRDEAGKPLAEMGLDVHALPRYEHLDYLVSGADGRYRIDYLPLGQNLSLSASKDSFQPESRQFRLGAGEPINGQLDLVVKRRPHGGSVGGVVTAAGKPIAGAQISNHGTSSANVRQTKTDAQGRFLLDNVFHTNLGAELIVRASRFAPQRVSFTPGTPEQPAEIAIQLEPGHAIHGRTVDEKGKPIAGAYVSYSQGDSPWGIGGSIRTDKEGRFRFDSLPDQAPFRIRASGYSELPETRLPLDGANEVVVTLKSQGIITGKVTDANSGQPLPRFNVSITFSPDRRPDEPSTSLASDRIKPGEQFASTQGVFTLKDLMAGMPLQVTIEAPGYERQVLRRVEVRAAADAVPLAIKLKPEDATSLQTVRGKLLNARGEPVRGAELRLIAAGKRPGRRDDYPFNWQMIETGQIEQVAEVVQYQKLTTGADGGFVFSRVPKNTEIELVYWGTGIPDARVDHLEQRPDKERANLVLTAEAPAQVRGTLDVNAFPEASEIQLSGNGRYYRATLAADKKTFTIKDVAPGSYEVQVYGKPRRIDDSGGFTTTVVCRRPIVLQAGQNSQVDLLVVDRVVTP